eukprot:2454060-Amphidinium_carterae.3
MRQWWSEMLPNFAYTADVGRCGTRPGKFTTPSEMLDHMIHNNNMATTHCRSWNQRLDLRTSQVDQRTPGLKEVKEEVHGSSDHSSGHDVNVVSMMNSMDFTPPGEEGKLPEVYFKTPKDIMTGKLWSQLLRYHKNCDQVFIIFTPVKTPLLLCGFTAECSSKTTIKKRLRYCGSSEAS